MTTTADMAQAIIEGRHFSKQLDGIPAIAIDDAAKLAKGFLAMQETLDILAGVEGKVGKMARAALEQSNATKESCSHKDAELNNPRDVSTRRLGEIVAECLGRWDKYPTIPGSLRWRRNGSMALAEILRRCHE